MKDDKDYKTNQSFGLLLKGLPKTGKTILAMQFPNPYIADCDNNLSGPIRFFRQHHPKRRFKYDVINIDDKGELVENHLRWGRLVECCKAAAKSPEVSTIIVDSLASAAQYLLDAILWDKQEANKSNNKMSDRDKKQMTIGDWIPFRMMLTRFVTTFRSVNKFFIMTSHEVCEKDDLTGDLYWRPALPSNLRDNFGGFFSDEWLLVNQVELGEQKRFVKTLGEERRSLGTSLNLPAQFFFEWDKFSQRLEEYNHVTKGE